MNVAVNVISHENNVCYQIVMILINFVIFPSFFITYAPLKDLFWWRNNKKNDDNDNEKSLVVVISFSNEDDDDNKC